MINTNVQAQPANSIFMYSCVNIKMVAAGVFETFVTIYWSILRHVLESCILINITVSSDPELYILPKQSNIITHRKLSPQ